MAELSHNNVYVIPVGLTQVQKDLLEILIAIHAESFASCVDKSLVPELLGDNNSNGLKRELKMAALTNIQLSELFFENVRATSNHPCLLVEHYMPRQFLLMEPSEKLIATSDKFDKLNLIVNLVLNRKEKNRSLQMAIVAHSVKELDLIEGIMLGKVAKLKRLSGTPLFDEKHEYEDDTMSGTSSSKECSTLSGSISNESHSKAKDEYNYSKSRKESRPEILDWLFLATTTHLMHSEDLLSRYNLDLIISFDPMLDETLPSICKLNKNGKQIPLVKLLVENSPDHYLLAKNLTSVPEDPSIIESLLHFIKHRADERNSLSLKQYEQITQLLVQSDDRHDFLPKMNSPEGNDKSLKDCLKEFTGLMPLTHTDYKLQLQSGPFDIKTYQLLLKKLTADRLKKCQHEYELLEKSVETMRMKESKRLTELDDLKYEAGRLFKKLKDNEPKLNDMEKKLQRTKTESEALDERINNLNERKREILRLLELDDVKKELETKIKEEASLSDELNGLEAENLEKTSANDELRNQYQQKSAQAASQASVLESLKAQKAELETKLNGPLLDYTKISSSQNEACLKNELRQMVRQSQFLIQYMNRVQEQYNIGNEPVKKTVPAESGSRYTTRVTRATSPAYT